MRCSGRIVFILMAGVAACGGAATPQPTPKASTSSAPAPAATKADPATEAAAEAAYDAKHFGECGRLYAQIADATSGAASRHARTNAACCHALDGQPDAAFAQLDGAIAGGLHDVGYLNSDPDLASLRSDPRWPNLIARANERMAAYEASLGDPALRRELLALVKEDRAVRMAHIKARDDPDKVEAMKSIDQKTTARMHAIVADKGWPGKSLVGEDGAHAAWLLLQHAEPTWRFRRNASQRSSRWSNAATSAAPRSACRPCRSIGSRC